MNTCGSVAHSGGEVDKWTSLGSRNTFNQCHTLTEATYTIMTMISLRFANQRVGKRAS